MLALDPADSLDVLVSSSSVPVEPSVPAPLRTGTVSRFFIFVPAACLLLYFTFSSGRSP